MAYFRDAEAKAILGVLAASCIGMSLFLYFKGSYPDYPTALRHTDLQSGIHRHRQRPAYPGLFALADIRAHVDDVLELHRGSSGSTGGGIKMIRTLVLAKQAHRELNQLVHPNMVRPLKVGGTVIANRVVFAVLAFVFLYFMSIVTLIFLQLASGLDFMTSFSSIIACINNAGPGLGLVGPGSNYGVLSDFQTWVCSAAMLLGRLEVFTILVLFTPTLWRK